MKTIYAKRTVLLAAAVAAASFAGTASAVDFEVGDTTASVYGYAKLDMIYDVDADLGNAVTPKNIRLDGADGPDGHTNFHAKQSRIGFKTSTPLAGSTLNTTIEGDFYGSGNDTLRLRHAFGEWNGILAGQTWTNFGGFLGMTPTIDFTGQPGQGNIGRQAQLRYTTGGFSVALEEPGTAGQTPNAGYSFPNLVTVNGMSIPIGETDVDAAKNSLPDLTMRYQHSGGDFNFAASGVLRELSYDAEGKPAAPQGWDDDSAMGWGVNLEASAKLSPAMTLRASLTHGDGIGGYLYGNPTAPAQVDDNGDLETIEATGGTLGMSMAAGSGNINLAYGIATADIDAGNDRFDSLFLNYIWSPVDRISYGIEAGYHTREQANGDDGDAVRLQGMAMYSF
ncbi:DcaP family trimeric outer membrane transporter [Vreelandella rituensis]|uniref:Porin n=1 Tax=Vreelandella rituensis TaxID=2282306 RepID=A0A368U5W3_9GAMM|nr:DcaP family trimeric outer membrane transporter [Halomonas rituensis]RCV92271.1 hypothetical protein DU506_08365 [Halomonas rituensis]